VNSSRSPFKWIRRVAYLVPLTAALVALGSANAQGQAEQTRGDRPIPAALVPPAGNVLSSVFHAEGVQVYQCTAGAWTFVEPAATLTGRSVARGGPKRLSAVHFRGPSWESTNDGTLVEARAVANSPVTGSIPELLLQATKTRGDGVFGRVTYIQRLATRGGVAPTGACTDGATTGVPYKAEYRFYVAG
jgi:hypothetical protein